MHEYDMMWGGGGMWAGPIIMIGIAVVVILLIAWLVKGTSESR